MADLPGATAGTALLAVGYPVSTGVLVRAVPVLRERRRRWFVALEAGTACVAVGWALRGRASPAVLNGGAVVGFALVWWATGRRR